MCRLDPWFWCVTKKQFVELECEVRDGVRLGLITNDFQELYPWPQEIFDNPTLGPNIHQVIAHASKVPFVVVFLCSHMHACMGMPQQVTAQYIKKITADYIPMPGVSWAIMKNLGKHGTPDTGMENSSS